MNILKFFTFAALILSIAGCNSAMEVKTQAKRPASFFTGLKTFTWHEDIDKYPSVGPQAKFHFKMKDLIENELTNKGYLENSTADFLVNYSISKGVSVNTSEYKNYSGYDPSFKWNKKEGLTRPSERKYESTSNDREFIEAGTLVIDLIHPKTNTLLWRSTAKKKIEEELTSLQAEQLLAKAVKEVLKNLANAKK